RPAGRRRLWPSSRANLEYAHGRIGTGIAGERRAKTAPAPARPGRRAGAAPRRQPRPERARGAPNRDVPSAWRGGRQQDADRERILAALKSAIWTAALVRRAQSGAASAFVTRRGDPDAGVVIVKVARLDGTADVYLPARDMEGERAWRRAAPAPMPEA